MSSKKPAPYRVAATLETRRKASKMYLSLVDKAMKTLEEILCNEDADHGHRIAAAKEINNRAFGQAASHATMLLEEQSNRKPVISQEALQSLTDEQLTQYAQLTRAIMNANENTIEGDSSEISSEG